MQSKAASFDPIGMTPPRGRHGHSVPTPRPLLGETPLLPNKLDSWATTDLQHSGSSSGSGAALSPAQFYAHRDHIFGGSLSKLDRMRPHHQDSSYMEAFDETEEYEDALSHSPSDDDNKYPASPSIKTEIDLGSSRRSSTGVAKISLDKLTGDSLLFFSYSTALGGSGVNSDLQLGGSFVRAFSQGLNTSLNVPYLQSTSPGGGANSGDQSHLFPTVARNPNKAIITIDAQTSRILIANEMTCELFGYQRDELVGMKIQNLFTEPYRGEQRALVEQNISAKGETVLVSGKVMDAVTSHGIEFPVSVWMKRIVGTLDTPKQPDPPSPCTQFPPTPRVIFIIEPVERSSALFSIDASHVVASCDPWFACMFGFQDSGEVIGKHVSVLIPSLKLPATVEELDEVPSKQAVTGRAKGGTAFPLTVKFIDVSQSSLSIDDLYSPTSLQQTTESIPATSSDKDGTSYISPSSHSSLSSDPMSLSGPYPPPHLPTTAGPSPSDILSTSDPSLPDILSTSDPSPPDILPTSDPSPPDILPTTDSSHLDPKSSMSPSNSAPLQAYINAKVVVYASLSGMISFFPDGSIHGCNHHFAIMLFGYSQQELLKKDITFLLPDFYQHVGCYIDDHNLPLPPLDEEEDALFHSPTEKSMSPDKASDFIKSLHDQHNGPHHQSSRIQAPPLQLPDTSFDSTLEKAPLVATPPSSLQEVSHPLNPSSSLNADIPLCNQSMSCDMEHASHDHHIHSALPINPSETSLPLPNRLVPSQSTERIMEILNQRGLGIKPDERRNDRSPLSSTPATKLPNSSVKFQMSQELNRSSLSLSSIPDGTFMGDARHKDGSLMAIVFQLKRITLEDGEDIFCMWLSRDLDMERARTADISMSHPLPPDPCRHDMIISPKVGGNEGIEDVDGVPFSHRDSSNQQFQAEELVAMDGEYSSNYNTLHPIGKGAFGFVRIAQKLNDIKTMVVVKFLRKSSVLKDCWITDSEMGRVPLEIALLARLSHPNIVQLLEAYENEYFFQMVMEKHGEGLDLFEFIERSPKLNEAHVSYIFRQVISALAYIHGKNIVHRDIKDENIIIDHCFHVKLIDFGSAAYMAPGKLFNTFCGTLEYCSPEVLLGNSYSGPELEMWAVGVTLYTLVFGENPFFDVEETISGHLQPPFLTTPALMKVLFWLLHPDPRSRATIRDLQKDKWTNQTVDVSQCSFDSVLGQVPGTEDGGHVVANCARGDRKNLPVKSSSEGEAIQLMESMERKLIVTEKKEEEEEAGDREWC